MAYGCGLSKDSSVAPNLGLHSLCIMLSESPSSPYHPSSKLSKRPSFYESTGQNSVAEPGETPERIHLQQLHRGRHGAEAYLSTQGQNVSSESVPQPHVIHEV